MELPHFDLIFKLINSKTLQTNIHFLNRKTGWNDDGITIIANGFERWLPSSEIMLQHENCIILHANKSLT